MSEIGEPQKEWQVHPVEWPQPVPQEAPHVPQSVPQEAVPVERDA